MGRYAARYPRVKRGRHIEPDSEAWAGMFELSQVEFGVFGRLRPYSAADGTYPELSASGAQYEGGS